MTIHDAQRRRQSTAFLLMLALLVGVAVWAFAAFAPGQCGGIAHAAECPVGSTATFSGDIGIQGGTTFTMTVTGAPTSTRTITLPNATTTLVGQDTTDTLTSKTLTNPTVTTGTFTTPDINGGTWNGTIDAASTATSDLTFNDSVNATFGTGGDVDVFYSGSAFVIDPDVVAASPVLINDVSNAFSTEGLTINQDAQTDEVLAFKNNVNHDVTGVAEADTYGTFSASNGAQGGLDVTGITSVSAGGAVELHGAVSVGTGPSTNAAGTSGFVVADAHLESANAFGAIADAENAFAVRNNGSTRFIVDGDGDVWIGNAGEIEMDDGSGNVLTVDAVHSSASTMTIPDGDSTTTVHEYQNGDLTATANTTLANTDLAFAVGANEVWGFQVLLFYDAPIPADLKVGWSLPASTTMKWDEADNLNSPIFDETDTDDAPGAGVGTDAMEGYEGVIATAGTSGTVTLQFAQQTSDAGTTTFQSNSYLIAWRLDD